MVLSVSAEEWLLSAGLLVSFFGFLVSLFHSRRRIAAALSDAGVGRAQMGAALLVVLLFALVELITVHPTQLLFFDDVIYQSMALHLITTGQAIMCNFGTPSACFSGQVFHEPVGTALSLAVGYLFAGVHLSTTYGTDFAVTALSVLMVFLSGALLFRNVRAALLSELVMGLSPIVLVWAFPTTSDMPAMLFALISLFSLLVFVRKRSTATLSLLLFSAALLTYMKVDAMLMLPLLLAGFVLLARDGAAKLRSGLLDFLRLKTDTLRYSLFVIFAVLVSISAVYAYMQMTSDDYGAVGTNVPNTCSGSQSFVANRVFSVQAFNYNVCANAAFWLDHYRGQYIMQPALFTLLAVVGAVVMIFERRRAWAFIALWFTAFFVLYTAFYAGAVTFGIDWRFMLACIAPVSLFAGYGAERLGSMVAENLSLARARSRMRCRLSRLRDPAVMRAAAGMVMLLLIAYPIFGLVPLLSVQPSQIQQAQDARYYESWAFQNANSIPSSCLVFSYDPTLFFINNRSSAQMYYIYNSSFMQNASRDYGCLVFDRGFWCYTPDNLCASVNQTYSLAPLATTVYVPENKTYGFYYLTKK